MKNVVKNFFSRLPLAIKIYVLIFVFGYPVAWLGSRLDLFHVYNWFDLVPALVWKGHVWRVVTYAFLPASALDWAISVFWLSTLVSVLARCWSGWGFWGYNLLGAAGGSLMFVFLKPHAQFGIVGSAAMVFALIVAWDWFFRHERIELLGIGELSVRQTALVIAGINSLILFFCNGWFCMLSMWCGGLVGWLYLFLTSKRVMNRSSQTVKTERMARLEL